MASGGRAQEVITDESIADIARLIERWESLAHEIQPVLTEPEIIEINNDYNCYIDRKIAYLRRWREKLGNRATYECLITRVRICGKENLANSISELIGITTQPQPSLPSHPSPPPQPSPPASPSSPSSLPPPDTALSEKISGLQKRFSDIIRELTQELSNKNLPCNDIILYIMSLPPERIGEHYNFLMQHMVQMTTYPHIFQFMLKLNMYMQFMDYSLLKEIIVHFTKDSNPELLKKMERYEKDIESFCRSTTIAGFITNWTGEEKVPEHFTTLQVKHKLDPNKCTLTDLEELRKKLGRKLGYCLKPRLIECAMIFLKVELGCVMVTWLVPVEILPHLMGAVMDEESRMFFAESGIEKVIIDKCVYYPDTASSHDEDDIETPTPGRQNSSPNNAEQVKPRCREVKHFMADHKGVCYVDEAIFMECYDEIRPKLDVSSLVGHLMKYDLVKSTDALSTLSTTTNQVEKVTLLVEIVKGAGHDGFMLLYMCLWESADKCIGHAEAVEELDRCAREKHDIDKRLSIASSIISGLNDPSTYTPTDEQIVQLETQFSALSASVLEELTKNQVDIDAIKQLVSSLPQRLQRRSSQPTGVSPATNRTRDMERLFDYLDGFIWSFIDWTLLHHIVERFGGVELRGEMSRYVRDFQRFENASTISQLIQDLPGQRDTPTNYCEVTARVSMNAERCTLARMNTLRKDICKRFLPPKAEFAVIHSSFSLDRAIVVKWSLALDLVPVLMTEVQKGSSSAFFKENRVESLYVRGIQVYTDPNMLRPQTSEDEVKSKITLTFQGGYEHMNSNGQYPSICMNNKGWVIQTYHRETVVNLRLRYKIGYLQGSSIRWSNHHVVYSRGYYPRITINDSGVVVAVFSSQVGKNMYMRIGELNYDDAESMNSSTSSTNTSIPDDAVIEWGEKMSIGEGRNPAVSISNKNVLVVVYEKGNILARTQYRIGDVSSNNVVWRHDEQPLIQSRSTKHASVAINSKNQLCIAYASAVERDIHFVAGQISNNNRILLGEETFTPLGINYQPVVSLNNHGHVAAVHHSLHGRLYLKINYGLFKPDTVTGRSSIEWSLDNPTSFAHDGYHASIAVGDNRKVVTAYKSLTLQVQKSVRNKIGELCC